ncbi:uncharacterized protein Tco025E_04940 [Trypanosoma conorhini]|uniref:Uncharacterized protein n=1 Tax=Trypanosoma conorhini TaxID=83891 RepID=A0A3R7MLE1_9TRYP|nr:uncharacterized protein Tco025E_04940 [Trypanosoma conorhini]RNF17087.1 hypothetical protein Tco025E_04940 [Trypanosoma conorhini]
MGSAASCGPCSGGGRDTPLKTNGGGGAAAAAAEEEEEGAWRVQLLREVVKDPTSVTRDFPRIPVYVRTAARHNYCAAGGDEEQRQRRHPVHLAAAAATAAGRELLASRCERVRASLELLTELCGEDALALHSVWEAEEQRLGTADTASLLLAVLLQRDMLQVRRKGGASSAFDDDASGAAETTTTTTTPKGWPRGYGAADAVMSAAPQYTVKSKTLRVMQYMAQGVVFFPLQWLTGVFQFPWCRRMQDVLWTVHVYTEKETNEDEAEERIILQHKQTLRHYVDPKELRKNPRFEIDWVCSICIDPRYLLRDVSKPPTMGEHAEVRYIKTEVLAARVEVPPKTMCFVSRTWRGRCRALRKRLWDRFKVELDTVSALHGRTVY